jgi:hypothetical protein
MKQMLFVAALSAGLGAATAVLFTRPAHEPRPEPARGLDAETLESAFARALERFDPLRVTHPPLPMPAARPDAEEETPFPPLSVRAAADLLPPRAPSALASLPVLAKDPEARRTWLFRTERDVIEWLGTPDEVDPSHGCENWSYETGDGKRATLTFHRGRLVQLYPGE